MITFRGVKFFQTLILLGELRVPFFKYYTYNLVLIQACKIDFIVSYTLQALS